MKNKDIIGKMFFQEKKNTIEIAKELMLSKQYVAKILSSNFPEKYKEEKEIRKNINKLNRNIKKDMEKAKKRKEEYEYEYDLISGLQEQQRKHAGAMSRSSKLSDEGIVYRCLNAYNVKNNNKLVYNEALGARPADLPPTLSLKIYR